MHSQCHRITKINNIGNTSARHVLAKRVHLLIDYPDYLVDHTVENAECLVLQMLRRRTTAIDKSFLIPFSQSNGYVASFGAACRSDGGSPKEDCHCDIVAAQHASAEHVAFALPELDFQYGACHSNKYHVGIIIGRLRRIETSSAAFHSHYLVISTCSSDAMAVVSHGCKASCGTLANSSRTYGVAGKKRLYSCHCIALALSFAELQIRIAAIFRIATLCGGGNADEPLACAWC